MGDMMDFSEIVKNVLCSSLLTDAAISFMAGKLLLMISLKTKKMQQC